MGRTNPGYFGYVSGELFKKCFWWKPKEKPLDSGKGLSERIEEIVCKEICGKEPCQVKCKNIVGIAPEINLLISEREEKIKLKAAQEEMITDYASILRLRDFTEKGDNIPFLSIRDIFDKRKEELKSKIRSIPMARETKRKLGKDDYWAIKNRYTGEIWGIDKLRNEMVAFCGVNCDVVKVRIQEFKNGN